MIVVRNRDLGTLTIHNVTYDPHSGTTLVAFESEAGKLWASLSDIGALTITDPAYPGLRWNVERFRPLIEEGVEKWNA